MVVSPSSFWAPTRRAQDRPALRPAWDFAALVAVCAQRLGRKRKRAPTLWWHATHACLTHRAQPLPASVPSSASTCTTRRWARSWESTPKACKHNASPLDVTKPLQAQAAYIAALNPTSTGSMAASCAFTACAAFTAGTIAPQSTSHSRHKSHRATSRQLKHRTCLLPIQATKRLSAGTDFVSSTPQWVRPPSSGIPPLPMATAGVTVK